MEKGAERVIAVDYFDYRLNHSKTRRTEIFDFTQFDDMGETLNELTKGGADVVIDCVGMDGKKSPLEFVEQKLKLQGGTIGPIQIATKAGKKMWYCSTNRSLWRVIQYVPIRTIFHKKYFVKNGSGSRT